MSKKDPVEGFGFAEHVSSFLLHEAFYYAHEAAAYEVASDIFEDRIKMINPDPSWKYPETPTTIENWLKRREEINENILDPETAQRMSEAWYSSLDDALRSGKKISKKRQFQSTTDIIGHSINLTVSLEAILNRHLFYLSESNQLTPSHYQSVDRVELIPKLLFCFKGVHLNLEMSKYTHGCHGIRENSPLR